MKVKWEFGDGVVVGVKWEFGECVGEGEVGIWWGVGIEVKWEFGEGVGVEVKWGFGGSE